MIQFHNKEHQYSVTGYDITTLALYVFCVAHNTHETGVDARLRRRFMYLVVSEFDILPKSLGGKSNCNLYFVSVFGTLSYGWNGLVYEANLAEKQPLQRYTTTCLVTIVIQRGCCQKGHLKMIHIYQCLFVHFPYKQYSDFQAFTIFHRKKKKNILISCIDMAVSSSLITTT